MKMNYKTTVTVYDTETFTKIFEEFNIPFVEIHVNEWDRMESRIYFDLVKLSNNINLCRLIDVLDYIKIPESDEDIYFVINQCIYENVDVLILESSAI